MITLEVRNINHFDLTDKPYKLDDMPCQFLCTEERKKLIHTVGVVAQGKLTIDMKNNNYTGIFVTGSDSLIVRYFI